MIRCQLGGIARWPRPETKERIKSRFTVSYPQLLEALDSELESLNAANVVLSLQVPLLDSKRTRKDDGWPLSDIATVAPGVMLEFCSQGLGDLVFACDLYLSWKENLREISLTLTALRAVSWRKGVCPYGQPYWGFKKSRPYYDGRDGRTHQEPPGTKPHWNSGQTPSRPTISAEVRDAATLLAQLSGEQPGVECQRKILSDVETFVRVFRNLAAIHHPDRGGKTEDMVVINNAADLLKKHHGI